MAHKRRSFLLFLSTIAICAVLGGVYGPRVEVAAAASDEDSIRSSFKTFTKIYSLVEENFADPVNPDKSIYKGAIPGMLRTLDPHSNFFDPHDFQILREDQKGHYFGVGMTVQPRNGKTIVLAPFNGSPAYKAGIRPGDVIVEVNDKKTDNLSTTEVADMLKGPRGTPVQIVVMRDGVDKPITFNVIRDEISRKSVQEALWVKPGIAYVDVDQFNENTSKELEDSLRKLGDDTFGKGLVQTVYPLSENAGLALTTAKYYTPSGRLIQRDYSNVSFFDYYYRKDTATRNPQDVKMTDSGRTVYGGGGISPDEQFVLKFDSFQTDLARKFAFFNFTKHYFGNREAKLPKGWAPDEKVVTQFHDYLLSQGFKFTEAEFTQDHDWIKQNLQREMYITAFSLDESRRIAIETDPMVE